MTTAQMISARILALVQQGMKLEDAFDLVMGAGAFKSFSDGLHDAFNKKN